MGVLYIVHDGAQGKLVSISGKRVRKVSETYDL